MEHLVAVKEWIVGLAAALAAALSIWTLMQSPAKKNADDLAKFKQSEFKDLDGRVSVVERGLGKLETVINQLPDKDSFHELDKGLTEVRGEIRAITATLASAGSSLKRIESFLIDSAKASKS